MTEGPPKKKRKVAKSKTCVRCRQHHAKCSGDYPCNLCSKNNVPCIYIAPKKRGPPRGYRLKYTEKIQELEAKILQQQEELELLRSTTQSNAYLSSQALSTSNVGVRMINASVVFAYVDRLYNERFIIPPDISRAPLGTISPDSFQAYAAAAFGAYVSGETVQKQQLENIAKRYSRELKTLNTPTVAGANAMLGMFMFCESSFTESQHYTKLAGQQIHQCRNNYSVASKSEKLVHHVVLFQQIKYQCGETLLNTVKEMCSNILVSCQGNTGSLSFLDKEILSKCLLSQVIRKVDGARLARIELTASQKTNILLRISQVQSMITNLTSLHVKAMITVAKAKFHLICGDRSAAYNMACESLELMLKNNLTSLCDCNIVKLLLELFAAIDAPHEFIQCTEYNKRLTKRWNCAATFCKILQRIMLMHKNMSDESNASIPVVQKLKIGLNPNAIMEAKKIAAMLIKLQSEGHTVLLSDSSFNDHGFKLDNLKVVKNSLILPYGGKFMQAFEEGRQPTDPPVSQRLLIGPLESVQRVPKRSIEQPSEEMYSQQAPGSLFQQEETLSHHQVQNAPSVISSTFNMPGNSEFPPIEAPMSINYLNGNELEYNQQVDDESSFTANTFSMPSLLPDMDFPNID